jgi:hypothetical protein
MFITFDVLIKTSLKRVKTPLFFGNDGEKWPIVGQQARKIFRVWCKIFIA